MRGYCWHGYTTTYKTHRQGDAAVQGKKLSTALYDDIGGGWEELEGMLKREELYVQ